MLELVIDNDILVKTSRYGRATELIHIGCNLPCSNTTGVLDSAPYVCRARLGKAIAAGTTSADAMDEFERLVERVELLEPDDHELALAAEIEEVALAKDLPIDGGESILVAVCCNRGSVILTGDKRAIVGVEKAIDDLTSLEAIKHRIACLEQAMATLALRHGGGAVRASVCGEPSADKALTNGFECGRSSVPGDYTPAGLFSYIDALRRDAPSVLMPGYEVGWSAASVSQEDGVRLDEVCGE